VHSYKYTAVATAAPSTRPCRSIMVRSMDAGVPGIARMSCHAHRMLLCVRHADVQASRCPTLPLALVVRPTDISCASSASSSCRKEDHTDRTAEAGRTIHAYADTAEPLHLCRGPSLAPNARTTPFGRRRGATDASEHVRQ
jgi:hypothetical protein